MRLLFVLFALPCLSPVANAADASVSAEQELRFLLRQFDIVMSAFLHANTV